MRRGEIRLVDLEPVRGSGARMRCPAVIVSNDGANAAAGARGTGAITVIPLTTRVETVFAFQALVSAAVAGLPDDTKAHAEQVRSVSVERVGPKVGMIPAADMHDIDRALRIQLGLV